MLRASLETRVSTVSSIWTCILIKCILHNIQCGAKFPITQYCDIDFKLMLFLERSVSQHLSNTNTSGPYLCENSSPTVSWQQMNPECHAVCPTTAPNQHHVVATSTGGPGIAWPQHSWRLQRQWDLIDTEATAWGCRPSIAACWQTLPVRLESEPFPTGERWSIDISSKLHPITSCTVKTLAWTVV